MKIQTPSSKRFASALATVAKCIQSKNPLAILDTVLLSQNNEGRFFITGGSTDAMLTIPVEFSIVEGKWTKSICLPTKDLTAYLNLLPDVVTTFEVGENGRLTLHYCTTSLADKDKAKNGKADFQYQDATEYPVLKTVTEASIHIVLPADKLVAHTSVARGFVCQDELRPQMQCVALDVKYDQCVIVASDGHSLYKHVHSNDPKTGGSDFYRKGEGTLLLNKDFIPSLAAFSKSEAVNIIADSHAIVFYADDITYTVLQLGNDRRYPNYNSVIPELKHFVTVNKKECLSVLNRVALLGSDTSELIDFNIDGSMFLCVKTEDIDFGTSAEDQMLVIAQNAAAPMHIGFRHSTLRDCINACAGEEITIWYADPSRAAVIKANDPNTPTLALCMPMLLNP